METKTRRIYEQEKDQPVSPKEVINRAYENDIKTLALMRKNLADAQERVRLLEEQIGETIPSLWEEYQATLRSVSETRKAEIEFAVEIRANAVECYAPDHPAIKLRRETVAEYLEEHAKKLAWVFLPAALKLDTRLFDRWVIDRIEKNPILQGYVIVRTVDRYTIATDLSVYMPDPSDTEAT